MKLFLYCFLLSLSLSACGLDVNFHRFVYAQEVKAFENLLTECGALEKREADFMAIQQGYHRLLSSYQQRAIYLDEEAHQKTRRLRQVYLKCVVKHGSQELLREFKNLLHSSSDKTIAL